MPNHFLMRIALSLFFLAQTPAALASGSIVSCQFVFSDQTVSTPSRSNIYDLYQPVSHKISSLKVGEIIDPSDPLYELATMLINENHAWTKKDEATAVQRIIEIKKVDDHPHYPLFEFFIATDYRPFGGNLETRSGKGAFRSNGYATFLAASYRYHQKKPNREDFKVVFDDGNGHLSTVQQTALVLEALPESLTLSRSMDPAELEIWKQNNLDQLQSKFSHNGTHFALNHYDFVLKSLIPEDRLPPVILKTVIPRALLFALYKRGQLMINTYESVVSSPQGMPEEARTSFGLEVEIVVLTDAGKSALLPYMQRGVIFDR